MGALLITIGFLSGVYKGYYKGYNMGYYNGHHKDIIWGP